MEQLQEQLGAAIDLQVSVPRGGTWEPNGIL